MFKNLLFLGLAFSGTLDGSIAIDAAQADDQGKIIKHTEPLKGPWIKLFDGKNLNGWHLYNSKAPIKNWTIEDGALVCLGAKEASGSGDIVTDQVFRDFELRWDWKVDTGSNSGVLYHIVEDPKYKRAIETAPEYQIIDDVTYPDKLQPFQLTGADYDMHLPPVNKILMPVGEWNTSKIIFKKGKVEHWLNGKRIIRFQAWSEDWKLKKAASKWKDLPDYGMSPVGRIGLQDHGNKAYFKNIEIREL